MTLNQNSLVAIALIFSITSIGVIALIRNTDTEIEIELDRDKSVNIKGKRSLFLPKPYFVELKQQPPLHCRESQKY